MDISVIYYSKSGNTKRMAEKIAEGITSVEGVSAKVFPMEEIDETYVKGSSTVIVGTPTYAGNLSGDVKCWLEKAGGKYGLAGKLGGAFATAAYIHGGADIAVQTVLQHMLFSGMMTYSSGTSCGNPVIHQGPVAIGGKLEEFDELFVTYGKRMAEQTVKVFGN